MNASVKVPVDALLGVPVGALVRVPVDALVRATLDTQPIDNSNPEALYTASNSAGPQTAPQSPRMELKGGGRYLPETRTGPGANRTKTEDWYHWGVDGHDLSSIYADQADNYLSVVNPYNQSLWEPWVILGGESQENPSIRKQPLVDPEEIELDK